MSNVDQQIDAIDNLTTHRRAWRDALVKAQKGADLLVPPEDDADRSYWGHEIRAFDNTFDALLGSAGESNLLMEMFRNGAAWAIGVRELSGRTPTAAEVEAAFSNLLPRSA